MIRRSIPWLLAIVMIGLPAAAEPTADGGVACSIVAVDRAVSPDNRLLVATCNDGSGAGLWLFDIKARSSHRLLATRADDTPDRNLTDLSAPHFSADGKTIYLMTSAWVTSDAIHAVAVDGSGEHFVAAGNALWVIRSGPYAGRLIVSQHMYHHGGGSYEQLWLLKPDGSHQQRIAGSKTDEEDPGPWLKRHGWRAD